MLIVITDVDDALNDPSGYSFIWISKQTLRHSNANISAITAILIILSLASNISFKASTSRQTFAFARDGGLPFSGWIRHESDLSIHIRVLQNWYTSGPPAPPHSPQRHHAELIITSLLSLVNIGSDVTFNAIISLFLVALMLLSTSSRSAAYSADGSSPVSALYRKHASTWEEE